MSTQQCGKIFINTQYKDNNNKMIRFVTSFSADGYERYAQKMLESVVENWHPDLKLTAYYHDCEENLVSAFPKASNIGVWTLLSGATRSTR